MLRKKYFKIGPYGLFALGLIVLASTLRIIVIAQGWPWMNSDEGTMGLMARHIAYQGELPIFFYGQGYMGALEAYAGGILFHLFGPSFFSLRLGLVLFYAAFLLALYFLTGLLYSKKLALVTLLLLCFGSIEMFTRQLRAVGGDEETMLFSTLIMLFTTLLILSFDRTAIATEHKRRYVLYSSLGLSMGLGLWSHMLVIPFIAMSALFLYMYCRSELRGRTILFLLGGFIVGLLPLLIFNVKYPAQNSLLTLWQLHSSGGLGASAPSYNLWDEIRGTVLVSLPMTTGANPLCSLTDVPGQWRSQISSCMIFQGSWGIGYILLLAGAIFLTARTVRRAYNTVNADNTSNGMQSTFLTDSEREKRLSALRLMLLCSAALTLLAYMFSAAPALVPITSTRYLVGLLVATPAILAPLWYGLRQRNSETLADAKDGRPQGSLQSSANTIEEDRRPQGAPPRLHSTPVPTIRRAMLFGRVCILLFIFAILVNGTLGVFQDVPHVQALNQQEGKLVNDLEQHHVTRMYADYWTCDLVMFLSNERIICSAVQAVNGKLAPGQNRYPAYTAIVQQDTQADYVLPVGSPEAAAFAQQAANSGQHYQHTSIDGYMLYYPT